MGVKFAKAMGAQVTMITTSPEKGKDALRLGADEVLVSPTRRRWQAARGASISCSTPSRSATTSIPIWTCSSSTATMVLVGALTHAGAGADRAIT